MIGLCRECGKRLKYDDIPEGFVGGAFSACFGTSFFIIYIFNWIYIPVLLSGVGAASFLVWFLTKKYGGYLVTESIEEYKKGNIFLSFLGWSLGAAFGLMWAIGVIQLFL